MRKLVLAATIVVAGLVAAYLASPYWTLHRIRSAADDGQGDRVAAYVDFPAVRESLKQQLSMAMNKRVDSRAQDSPLASVGQAFARQMINSVVDAMVSQESISTMIRSGKAPRALPEAKADGVPASSPKPRELRVRRSFQDLNTFQAALVDHDTNADVMTVVLSRDGLLTWKLTAITIPGLLTR